MTRLSSESRANLTALVSRTVGLNLPPGHKLWPFLDYPRPSDSPQPSDRARAPEQNDGSSEPSQRSFDKAWELMAVLEQFGDGQLGQHSTPQGVARSMALRALQSGATRVFDPACGTGALLLAWSERVFQVGGDQDNQLDWSRLEGVDVDPLATALAELVLWIAAGQPVQALQVCRVADALTEPMARDSETVIMANPPWGVRVAKSIAASWLGRNPGLGAWLEGELSGYTLFLLEAACAHPGPSVFLTPIHWLLRRSHAPLRRGLQASHRLREVVVLRKRVFLRAPDMIPVISTWTSSGLRNPTIRLVRTGFRARLPLESPLPKAAELNVSSQDWGNLPYAIFPLLRTPSMSADGQRLLGNARSRLSDPRCPRSDRWLHIGDGIYKSRVMPAVVDAREPGAVPILTRARDLRRYGRIAPTQWLTAEGVEQLRAPERRRLDHPRIVMHALKKASAPNRLLGSLYEEPGPLGCTNNFLLVTPQCYEGDLAYPLGLLNSRVFNQLYGEHFAGVNIEAYTVGLLPFPWPIVEVESGLSSADVAPKPVALTAIADVHAWYQWARHLSLDNGRMPRPVYEEICRLVRDTCDREPSPDSTLETERCLEAIIAGLLHLSPQTLDFLLQSRS